MARPRKPVDHLKLHGTFDKSRHAKRDKQEPRCSVEPQMPDYLAGDAAEHWQNVVPMLVQSKIATGLDTQALVDMCEWWAELRRLKKRRDRKYATFQMMQMASKRWHEYAKNFGLTPAARTSLMSTDSKTTSAAEEFLA